MSEITIENIREALEYVRKDEPKCSRKHDYTETGHCFFCNKLWLSKEDQKLLNEFMRMQK